MNDEEAKQRLTELLDHYTAGSVLHLIAELFREVAEEAQKADDAAIYDRCKLIEHSLFVFGLGIDAASPS